MPSAWLEDVPENVPAAVLTTQHPSAVQVICAGAVVQPAGRAVRPREMAMGRRALLALLCTAGVVNAAQPEAGSSRAEGTCNSAAAPEEV